MAKLGPNSQKALLLFVGGLTLGLSPSPKHFFRIAKSIHHDWQKIKREELYLAIRNLYKSKLVEEREESDGQTVLIISESGKRKVLTYKLDEMIIRRPKIWDKKWRLVIFDIPENRKKFRDALRRKLKELDFYELQKSVFVFPFECQNELDFIIEFFQLRPYVRCGLLQSIDNDLHLRKIFKLI